MGERIHEIGRYFVQDLKEVLENTYNFVGITTAYEIPDEDQPITIIEEKLNGDPKIFDLGGIYKKNEESIGVYIEAKNFSSATGLIGHYTKFLRDSFSVWIKKRTVSKDWKAIFLFVSTHPFACSNFSTLKEYDFLKHALESENDLMEYLIEHTDSVLRDFLDYFDILILNDSKILIRKYNENKIKSVKEEGINLAIEVSRKSRPEDEQLRPKVGAVLIKDNRIIETILVMI